MWILSSVLNPVNERRVWEFTGEGWAPLEPSRYLDISSRTTQYHVQIGMMIGLQKFSGSWVRQRGSSPKLLALNTALMALPSPLEVFPGERFRRLSLED